MQVLPGCGGTEGENMKIENRKNKIKNLGTKRLLK